MSMFVQHNTYQGQLGPTTHVGTCIGCFESTASYLIYLQQCKAYADMFLTEMQSNPASQKRSKDSKSTNVPG